MAITTSTASNESRSKSSLNFAPGTTLDLISATFSKLEMTEITRSSTTLGSKNAYNNTSKKRGIIKTIIVVSKRFCSKRNILSSIYKMEKTFSMVIINNSDYEERDIGIPHR